ICASLDATGALITVQECIGCLAEAGTMTADEPTVCFDLDLNEAAIGATPNGDAVVPPGFVQVFVLTQGPDLTIVDGESAPAFTVFAPGTYTIHSFVYDPATLDITWVVPGTTTAGELLDFAASEGACVSLDAAGAAITVQYCIDCDAEAGALEADANEVCLMLGEAVVSATHTVLPVLPPGYEVAYALTEGPGLVIVALAGRPAFTVSAPGSYTIHTLVYDPATIDPGLIEIGVTTGFDINSLLVQGGGIICGALDVAGAPVTVSDCSPANDDCINALPLAINAIGSCPAGALAGNNTYATMDGEVPSCDNPGSYLFDVWYAFNAGDNSEVTLTLDPGTMEDWVVAIYDGCGGNELACFIMPEEPIVLATDPFADYVVQVYSNFTYGNGGQFTICLEGDVPTFICDGGQVQTSTGEFSVTVCQDTEADVIDFITTSVSGESYDFLLTDDNDVIIAVLSGGSLDFNSAPAGLYRVWGISYNGTLVGADPGALATEVTSTGACIDLSDNYVLVSVELCSGMASASATPWNLFPNPGNGDFTLVYAGESALVSVEVLDLGGRVAHAERVPMVKGQPHAFGLAGRLAPGSYVVRLRSEGQSASLPLVVR
ncbi:MAG: T9SS type A sorting domain-containing protein, partial [Flavobacteriales bacterium]